MELAKEDTEESEEGEDSPRDETELVVDHFHKHILPLLVRAVLSRRSVPHGKFFATLLAVAGFSFYFLANFVTISNHPLQNCAIGAT